MVKRRSANLLPAPKLFIGYARVSTDHQLHDAQMDELRATVCASGYFKYTNPVHHGPDPF